MSRRPHRLVCWLTAAVVRRKLPPGPRPRVLLTFDDGPTVDVTVGVLERLAAHGARAVFFVIGERAAQNPDLLKKVQQGGHVLGNHSQTHPVKRWPALGPYVHDLRQCNQVLGQIPGQETRLFRAPEGRLHAGSVLGARQLGMKHMLWSLDSLDWTCTTGEQARQCALDLLQEVADGDIILLHEYARWTWDLLDVLLPGLVSRGFDLNSGLEAVL